MEDDIGDMVRCLFGASAVASGTASGDSQPPPNALAAASEAAAQQKVTPSDIVMTEDLTAGGVGTPVQTDTGVTHFQCVAARAASCQIEATSIAADATFGKTLTLEAEQIGILNPIGEKGVDKTFHGARIKRGGDTVNQSVTMTIDPANLHCIVCKTEHLVVQNHSKPVVIILSDQNFVPIWPNTTPDACAVVIRMSNPDLHELFEFLSEVFDRTILPDGSMVLAGSVSYLLRVGTSFYARKWAQVLNKMGGCLM